jgi:DNA-binding CsgD family transcriptional regulator
MTGPEKISGRDYEFNLNPVVKLLQHLSEPALSRQRNAADAARFESIMSETVKALDLISCTLFQISVDDYFDGIKLKRVASVRATEEKASSDKSKTIPKVLEIPSQSELHSLLNQEQWVPLGEACLDKSTPLTVRDLGEFCGAKEGLTSVLFPAVADGVIVGVLLMERALSNGGFSEEILDLGQVVSRLLAAQIGPQTNLLEAENALAAFDQSISHFEQSSLPTFILRRDSLNVENANAAAIKLLGPVSKKLIGQPLQNVFPGSRNFLDALRQSLSRQDGNSCFSVSASDLKQIGCGAALVSVIGQSENLVSLQFIPRNFLAAEGDAATKTSAADDLDEVSKRLGFERWLRQTVCKLHSSLDRDHLLQTLADSLGRVFRATRCLVIRTDGLAPMVTHEYVEPDLSPLGLGRTGQFPMKAINLFQHKTVGIDAINKLRQTGQLNERDVDILIESGISAMAGAPLSHQGSQYGVVILLIGDEARSWSEEDLETIELTISQASIALSHSQTYHQVKDQLFHMNLLGNLTQQLTNALEVAAKAPAPKQTSRFEEKVASEDAPPLSSREMEVLKLIASGFANKEIAQRLFLTESTVELHASRIRKKLNLKSRTALVKYACDNNFV